jgi:hypothetical protein
MVCVVKIWFESPCFLVVQLQSLCSAPAQLRFTELVRFMRNRVGGILDEMIFVLDNIIVMWRTLHKEFRFVIKVSE